MSDDKLRNLKTELETSAQDCATKAGNFWGQGFQDGSDLYNKNAEEFNTMAQEVGKELEKRAKSNEQPKAEGGAEKQQEQIRNQEGATVTGTGEVAKVPSTEASTAETTGNTRETQTTSSSSSNNNNKEKSRF